MKLIFVGPTLPDARDITLDTIAVRPPACQGDILQAVRDGANIIGLIDGNFEYRAPVWHKEILFALSEGMQVFGAASMGALRAAECTAYGMVGIGEISRQYIAGKLQDDADVAQLHAPEELGFRALSEPLVNIRATLRRLLDNRQINADEHLALEAAASALFFKRRTIKSLVEHADLPSERKAAIAEQMKSGYVDRKRLDAIALLEHMKAMEDRRNPPPAWDFQSTSLWRHIFDT
jgi:hypothetical protein